MELSELDLFILKKILKKDKTSSWALAKDYSWEEKNKLCQMKKNELNEFYTKKSNMIEYRLRLMKNEGFILLEKNGEEIFVVDSDRVKLGKKKFITGTKESLEILFSNNKCVIFEI